MDRILLDLIALVYWSNKSLCEREFDEAECYCRNGNNTPCRDYEFCRLYRQAKEELEAIEQNG